MDNQKIGNLIKNLRTKQGLTQKELGEKLNITGKAISKWERGLSLPDISLIPELAKVLSCSEAELLKGECEEKQEENKIENMTKKKKIFGIVLLFFGIVCFIAQIVYLFVLRPRGIEYIFDWASEAVTQLGLICIFGAIGLFCKKGFRKNLVLIASFSVFTIINLAVLFHLGFAQKTIFCVSKDFSHTVILKQETSSRKNSNLQADTFGICQEKRNFCK